MSANTEQKAKVVDEIKSKIKSAKSIVFVNYNGVCVADDTALRASCRAANVEYKVYKNRLMLIALNELGMKGCEEYLNGTSAVIFSYNDEVSAPKVLMENAVKDNLVTLKFGIVNGKVVVKDEIEKLSKLPSKNVLIAKLLSILNGPASSLVRVINAPTTKLTVALSEIAKKS